MIREVRFIRSAKVCPDNKIISKLYIFPRLTLMDTYADFCVYSEFEAALERRILLSAGSGRTWSVSLRPFSIVLEDVNIMTSCHHHVSRSGARPGELEVQKVPGGCDGGENLCETHHQTFIVRICAVRFLARSPVRVRLEDASTISMVEVLLNL